MAGGRKKARKPKADNENVVSPFLAQHGEYRESTVVDLSGELGGRRGIAKVLRNLYPNIADRWLADGGPGFDEPQRRAIDHCRSLWVRAQTEGRLVANLDRISGAGGGDGWSQQEALSELATFKRRLPEHTWSTFENVVRWDEPAGAAGSKYAANSAQQQAHAKAAVGFVASMIALWRGF